VRAQFTSPRLRGEVGSSAQRSFRVRGSFGCHLWLSRGREMPLTQPSPRRRGEGASRKARCRNHANFGIGTLETRSPRTLAPAVRPPRFARATAAGCLGRDRRLLPAFGQGIGGDRPICNLHDHLAGRRRSRQPPRLNPGYTSIHFYFFWLGYDHLLMNHADRAIDCFRKACAVWPRSAGYHLFLASALGLRGDTDEAKSALS
jgi:hypothetical protein